MAEIDRMTIMRESNFFRRFVGYVWSDKTPVEFTRWNPQQPDSHQGQQPCVEMYSTGEWGDTGCYSVKQSICKMPRCKYKSFKAGSRGNGKGILLSVGQNCIKFELSSCTYTFTQT